MDSGNFISSLLITLAVLVVIFLVLREVVCWYWKINSSIALLTEIRDLLAKNTSVSQQSSSNNSLASISLRDDPAPSDEQKMETYGITFDGERYTYGEYKYENLSDAVNYAKRQNKRSV